jgi:hypothetical protein
MGACFGETEILRRELGVTGEDQWGANPIGKLAGPR